MNRKTSVIIRLSVFYKPGVYISLSKDVNTETKISIIWLLLCVDVTVSVWHWEKNIQGVYE